ncbi:hypothetical protein GPECTOR_31g367 [Gonium pectorale]|uniref:Right handed beta helix domain-containing protein n=1 Tax=Gonium pectorale TaxID=33097 RepID=A0A150GE03_GONPE|nr:hypothetical protein GPECTOR_31g367 [Gonium pectorale]|eukprot:KXZ48003.1 hypothetical protein GPECTOR_31g367 [Gonium pectorale]
MKLFAVLLLLVLLRAPAGRCDSLAELAALSAADLDPAAGSSAQSLPVARRSLQEATGAAQSLLRVLTTSSCEEGPSLSAAPAGEASHTCRVVLQATTTAATTTASTTVLGRAAIECWMGSVDPSTADPASLLPGAKVAVRLGKRLAAAMAAASDAVASGVTWNKTLGAAAPSGPTGGYEDGDWGVDLLAVPHLLLADSVVSGLPLSRLAPLLQCLGCGRVTVRNLTLADLSAPADATAAPADAVDTRPYGAARFTGLSGAELSGVSCSGVRGGRAWACLLLQAQAGGANIRISHSAFTDNAAVLPAASANATAAGAVAAYPPPPPVDPASAGLYDAALLRHSSGVSAEGLGALPYCGAVERGFGAVLITAAAAVGAPAPASTTNLLLDSSTLQGNAGSCGAGLALVDVGFGGGAALRAAVLDVTLLDSFVQRNVATGSGGGLFAHASASLGSMTVSSGALSLNRATSGGGGGAYLAADGAVGATAVLNSTEISGNRAFGDGGGLLLLARSAGVGPISISSASLLSGNTAQYGSGGALYVLANASDVAGLAVSDGAVVASNLAGESGGGAFLASQGAGVGAIRVEGGSRVSNNTAGIALVAANRTADAVDGRAGGGGFYVRSAAAIDGLTVDGATLSTNVATAGSGGAACLVAGGAVGTVAAVSFCTVSSNAASAGDGGAIYVRALTDAALAAAAAADPTAPPPSLNVNVSDGASISRNRAVAGGGGFLAAVVGGSGSTSVIVEGRSIVSTNVAARGGAFYVSAHNISMSVRDGSALQVNQATCTNATGCAVAAAAAADGASVAAGGGAHLAARGALRLLQVVDASILSGNRAAGLGGGVYATAPLVELIAVDGGSYVADNSAGIHGGGIYARLTPHYSSL